MLEWFRTGAVARRFSVARLCLAEHSIITGTSSCWRVERLVRSISISTTSACVPRGYFRATRTMTLNTLLQIGQGSCASPATTATAWPSVSFKMSSRSGRQGVIARRRLAGLTAARPPEARGAAVTVVEARTASAARVTMRTFAGRPLPSGADLIEEEQEHVLALARAGLKPVASCAKAWVLRTRRARPSQAQSGLGALANVKKYSSRVRDFKPHRAMDRRSPSFGAGRLRSGSTT